MSVPRMRIPAITILLSLICGIVSCAIMPKILPGGKVSSTETELVALWNADDHAEDMMTAGGWAKPVASLQDESELWLWLAAVNGGLMSLAFAWAYISHQHSMIGAGVVFALLALFCTGVSAVMTMIAWIVGGVILLALVWAAVKLRSFSLVKWFKERK